MAFDWAQYPVTVLPLLAQARLQALDDAVVAGGGGAAIDAVTTAQLAAHVAATNPHPSQYDDMPSLTLRFLNGLA